MAAVGNDRKLVTRALNRLILKGELASPQRGFYVIVPPEYQQLGCLPAEQFARVGGSQPSCSSVAALRRAARPSSGSGRFSPLIPFTEAAKSIGAMASTRTASPSRTSISRVAAKVKPGNELDDVISSTVESSALFPVDTA
ncbi:MAG: hypothetical protein DRQ56_02820 [Gammaproteobacteria bacterium]|nr:MAG: hypothetical protein DRQ56_02820 [Gammaproteobacteria bacterium]